MYLFLWYRVRYSQTKRIIHTPAGSACTFCIDIQEIRYWWSMWLARSISLSLLPARCSHKPLESAVVIHARATATEEKTRTYYRFFNCRSTCTCVCANCMRENMNECIKSLKWTTSALRNVAVIFFHCTAPRLRPASLIRVAFLRVENRSRTFRVYLSYMYTCWRLLSANTSRMNSICKKKLEIWSCSRIINAYSWCLSRKAYNRNRLHLPNVACVWSKIN